MCDDVLALAKVMECLRHFVAAGDRGTADNAATKASVFVAMIWRVTSISCPMGISLHVLLTLTKRASNALCVS